MSEIIQENWIYFLVAYLAVFGWVLYKALFANRGKIKVRVKTPTKEWVKWCKPQPDGQTIVVEKAKRNKAGWSFKFSNKSLVPFSHRGRSFFAIDVFYESKKAIEYDYARDKATAPELTQQQVTHYAQARIWERRYQTDAKQMPNWILYVILLLQIGSMIFTYLLQSGRLRL